MPRRSREERKKRKLQNIYVRRLQLSLVLEAGLEPARTNVHQILSLTCLPIPPLEHNALQCGASEGIRTLDPHLGKVMLYP